MRGKMVDAFERNGTDVSEWARRCFRSWGLTDSTALQAAVENVLRLLPATPELPALEWIERAVHASVQAFAERDTDRLDEWFFRAPRLLSRFPRAFAASLSTPAPLPPLRLPRVLPPLAPAPMSPQPIAEPLEELMASGRDLVIGARSELAG